VVSSVVPETAAGPACRPRPELEARAWQVLGEVQDPEIPVLSVVDLGVIRHVRADDAGTLEIGLAPTYSGCPATAVIRASVIAALRAAGFDPVTVVEVLSPPWTSDWLSADGRRKLEHYGIAPPAEAVGSPRELWRAAPTVRCPRCASQQTTELSPFGSTPCKALYRCTECLEPFEYFKCI
jgi:ring-1,2-phenylacetyl-CoA epoxidase subunit PaaD